MKHPFFLSGPCLTWIIFGQRWKMSFCAFISSAELPRTSMKELPVWQDMFEKWQCRKELRQQLSGIFWHVKTFILFSCQLFSVWFYLFSFFISSSCCLALAAIILDLLIGLSFLDNNCITRTVCLSTSSQMFLLKFLRRNRINRQLADQIDQNTTLSWFKMHFPPVI